MNEPTREQIKEAFQKTIKRWERIVEEPSYYQASDCQLCGVYGEYKGDNSCHKYCPIRSYGNYTLCVGTPHDAFSKNRTSENALAELNFLRKVYIWWMENGRLSADCVNVTGVAAEKKEEMEDKERACGDCESFELEKNCGESGRCVSKDVWRGKERPRIPHMIHRDWIACMYWRKAKEEKKEEWEDITNLVDVRFDKQGKPGMILEFWFEDKRIFFSGFRHDETDKIDSIINMTNYDDRFKIVKDDPQSYRILKKI